MSGFYWLVSYPKSGNTWLRLALLSVHQGGRALDFSEERGWCPNAAGREYFDQALDIESSDFTHDECESLRPSMYRVLARERGTPALLKVHDAFVQTSNGEPLFPLDVTLGVVYLVRDPRDVAVSLAHHQDQTIDKSITTMATAKAALATKSGELSTQLQQRLLTWSDHVQSWIDSGLSVLLIRYEEMLTDCAAVLSEVVSFIGWTVDAHVISSAVEATRFDSLRAQEERHGFRERRSRLSPFFRRGVAGGWRDSLSATQVQQIESDHARVMRRLGYGFAERITLEQSPTRL